MIAVKLILFLRRGEYHHCDACRVCEFFCTLYIAHTITRRLQRNDIPLCLTAAGGRQI